MLKSERIDIRTSVTVKSLLQQAAETNHKSVSEFLLEHGLIAASETLASRKIFALDDKQWRKFQDTLDQPTQHKPRLKKLLSQPGIFD